MVHDKRCHILSLARLNVALDPLVELLVRKAVIDEPHQDSTSSPFFSRLRKWVCPWSGCLLFCSFSKGYSLSKQGSDANTDLTAVQGAPCMQVVPVTKSSLNICLSACSPGHPGSSIWGQMLLMQEVFTFIAFLSQTFSSLLVLRKGTGLNSYQDCHSTNQSGWKWVPPGIRKWEVFCPEVVTVGLLSSLPTAALLLGDLARALHTASCRYHIWAPHSICFQTDTGGNRAWGTAWKRLRWAGCPWHRIPGHHIRDKLFQTLSPSHVFLTYLATRVSPAYLEPNYFLLLC